MLWLLLQFSWFSSLIPLSQLGPPTITVSSCVVLTSLILSIHPCRGEDWPLDRSNGIYNACHCTPYTLREMCFACVAILNNRRCRESSRHPGGETPRKKSLREALADLNFSTQARGCPLPLATHWLSRRSLVNPPNKSVHFTFLGVHKSSGTFQVHGSPELIYFEKEIVTGPWKLSPQKLILAKAVSISCAANAPPQKKNSQYMTCRKISSGCCTAYLHLTPSFL